MSIPRHQLRRVSIKHRSKSAEKEEFDFENQYEKSLREAEPVIFDTSVNRQGLMYWQWSIIVCIACLYNLLFISLPVFEEISYTNKSCWLTLNFVADIIYLLDMFVQCRKNFYDSGCIIADFRETRLNYLYSLNFVMDMISIIPTDLILLLAPGWIICRLNRIVKCYRIYELYEISYGRLSQLMIALFRIVLICGLIFHWNACLFYVTSLHSDVSKWLDLNGTFDDDYSWPWPYLPEKITDVHYATDSKYYTLMSETFVSEEREQNIFILLDYWDNKTATLEFSDFWKKYILSMYWSSLTMTTLGEQPSPNLTIQNILEIFNTIFGMILFAGIMGSIADLVENANRAKQEWQTVLDGLKQYLTYRSIEQHPISRVVMDYCEFEIERLEYKEEQVKSALPKKLYLEVGKRLNWKILARHPMLQDSEVPTLCDLVSCFEVSDFGPKYVIASAGELKREMHLVSRGTVRIVYDADLNKESMIFGEEQLIGADGLFWFSDNVYENRRNYSIISEGFSEVYTLQRDDFFKVLRDYPHERERLRRKARELQKEVGEIPRESRKYASMDEASCEEELLRAKFEIGKLEKDLEKQYTNFIKNTMTFKRRLFRLEKDSDLLFRKNSRGSITGLRTPRNVEGTLSR